MEQVAARSRLPCTMRSMRLVLVVILLWPSLLTAHPHSSHVNHRLVRRGATPPSPPSGSESPSGHTGAPPPEARQVEPPDGGRGNRGASPPGEAGEEVGLEETPASTANLAQPVSDGTGGGVDGLHPGIIVVLSLVCVFLFVLLLVCTAALIRYTVVQRRKKGRLSFQKNVPRSGLDSDLWAEGARYSPATPQTLPNRKRARDSKGQPRTSTDTTRASHISTELYRAVYPYSPTEDTQLRLEPGSVIDVVEKTEGWWRGYAGPKEGWFPANYVERVYQPDSCATLEDYTDDMGGRHSRHLRAERHTTNRAGHTHHHTSTTPSITHSSRDSVLNRGLDEVDFQAGRQRSIQDRPIPLPPTAPLPDPEVEAAQPMVPKHKDGTAEDPAQEEDFALRIPNSGSSGGEENLLQSIFNDLEKAWSKAQVSTPINKDYYKLEPLESSLQPIPLAESFGEEDSYYTKRHSAAGSHASSTPSPQQDQEEGLQQTLEQADGGPIVEDTYINREDEIQRVEEEEDMYINCQAERHEAEKEEEAAQEEMEVVHHGFDKILQDCINREAATKQEEPEPPVEPVSDSANVSYRALYSYVPRQPDELPITADELLLHVSNISNDWVRVRNTSGEEGLVPLLYISQDPNSPSHQEAQIRHRSPETPDSEDWDINEFDNDVEGDITAIEYVTIYDYEPQQDGDLPLRVGDKVAVLEMHENGWWKGLCMQQEGWFPGSYVEMSTLSSTPNTPAATALSPFASVLAQAINDAKDQTLVKTPVQPEGDDVPPPLPTCPPPTDEELEELEQKLREQREQLEKEKASHKEESPLSSPQHVILPTRITAKDSNSITSSDEYLQPVPDHGRNNIESKKPEPGLVKVNGARPVVDTQAVSNAVNKPVEAKTTVQVRPGPSGRPNATGYESDATTSSEIEASPPRPVIKPPVGFGGSDFGISSNDESEPERFRSKLAKRFGKPKFVKIPKKILPQVRRGGSMGKRTAPPAPEHRRLEISAPILQQTSDPMRIAASQELRVSFQEPIVEKSPEAKKAEAIATIDPPHNDSPGILKNKSAMIYKSPHGGSYEDIVDKRSSLPNGDNHKCVPSRPNSRPVSQASNGSVRSNTPESRSSDHSGRGHTVQRQRLPSVEAQPTDANRVTTPSSHSGIKRPNKTPPPRPRPISNTPMSAPHPSQKPPNKPPLRQSVSLTSTPTVHHSSGAVYRQSSVGAPVQEELSPDLQPVKGRRRSHRPSAPPPPRPKMPPPPRPPGPPPGRVGAHGDGLHPDQKRLSGYNQRADQWIELNGLDCSQTSADIIMQPLADRANSQQPETMNNSVDSQKSSIATKGSLSGYVDLHESVQGAPADVTFTVNKAGARTNTKVKATSDPRYLVSSHLTESSDFDEVDGPVSNFQVISMTDHSKRLNAGPRDSFRKYKKQVGGGKRSSLSEAKHQGVAPQARAQHKAKSQTLPTTATPSLMMEDDDPVRNIGHYDMPRNLHYDVPRSLTLGRQEGTVTGPTKRWSSPPTSPSEKPAPQRPPPPAVSPGSPVKKFPSGQNGDVQHTNRAERPVKPPRKDKIRRSTESYLASEKGELSFEEDTVIRDIGEVSMTRSISTNASEPPRPSGDIVWI